MTEAELLVEGLEEVFKHRQSFIVIGLTGRTGSGCSSAARLLNYSSFEEVGYPLVPWPEVNNEDRKSRIIAAWLKEHWRPFNVIQVSLVIFLSALSRGAGEFLDWCQKNYPECIDEIKIIDFGDDASHIGTILTLRNLREASVSQVEDAYAYLFDTLPSLLSKIKEKLNGGERKSYAKIFQSLGDNIRRSGFALSEQIDPKGILFLPELLSRVIKLSRLQGRISGRRNDFYVIDALRHPFEIRYLKERISQFYTVAITTGDADRKVRLQRANFRNDEITLLDSKEYPSERKVKPEGYEAFVSQDIQSCLSAADIYIHNPGSLDSKNLTSMAAQVCRYVALMQHPGLITPTKEERCMQLAFAARLNSGCISRQVGALVTDSNFSVKSIGWNDVAFGQVPCLLRNTAKAISANAEADTYSEYERNDETFRAALKKSKFGQIKQEFSNGRNVSYCFKSVYNVVMGDKNQVHTRALHAEENAFLQISKYGGSGIEGGCLFTTASPCELCAKKAYQLGIKNIFYIDPYPGISDRHIFASGTIKPELILFSGAIGRAYHEIYSPLMPFKDELERLLVSPSKKPLRDTSNITPSLLAALDKVVKM